MSPRTFRVGLLATVCLLGTTALVISAERRRTTVTVTVGSSTTQPTTRPTNPRAAQEEAARQRVKKLINSRVRGLRMLDALRKRNEVLNQQNADREQDRRRRRGRGT